MKPLPEMERDEIYQAAFQLKRMIRNLGKLHHVADLNDFVRCSGSVICPSCGLEYFDHPAVGEDGILHLACNGQLLKL